MNTENILKAYAFLKKPYMKKYIAYEFLRFMCKYSNDAFVNDSIGWLQTDKVCKMISDQHVTDILESLKNAESADEFDVNCRLFGSDPQVKFDKAFTFWLTYFQQLSSVDFMDFLFHFKMPVAEKNYEMINDGFLGTDMTPFSIAVCSCLHDFTFRDWFKQLDLLAVRQTKIKGCSFNKTSLAEHDIMKRF